MIFSQVELPKAEGDNLFYYIAAGAVAVGVLILLSRLLGKKQVPDLQGGLRENLADYPPAPATHDRVLTIQGVEGRIRLIVVAPMGKQQAPIDGDDVPEILDDVLRGLGRVAQQDKPRIKVWPPQLAAAGFAPTFHRLVAAPGPAKPSNWVKIAQPARAGDRPILLGIVLYSDRPAKLGELIVQKPAEWVDILRIESV